MRNRCRKEAERRKKYGKICEKYVPVLIASVKKISDMEDEEWGWRDDTVGRIGVLYLYQSGTLYHVVHRTIFHELRTSKGVLKTKNNTLKLTTKNTEYVFEILKQTEI